MPSPMPIPAARGRWSPYLVAAAIVLLIATGVRVYKLGAISLWTDEYLSLECSAGWGRSDLRVVDSHEAAPDLLSLAHARPWTDVWGVIARDENHPPLYFIVLRGWRTLFGDSATGIRSLSVVSSVLAVGLMMAAGAEAAGPTAGLWAGLVMALAAPQIREAQDARAYMPVTAVSVAALWLVIRTVRRGPDPWRTAALAVVLLVMPLLHYMALATVAAVGLFGVVGLAAGPARRAVLAAVGAALAAYAVLWGPHLVGQHQRMLDATKWLADPDGPGGHTWRTLVNLAAVPVRLVVDPGRHISPLVLVGGLATLVLPLAAMGVARRQNRPGQPGPGGPPPRPATSVLPLTWLWVAVPVLTALVIDLTSDRQSLTLPKYTLAAAPALYLMAATLATSGRRLAWAPAAAVVACGLLCLSSDYLPQEPDWRPLVRFVAAKTAPGDPVVLVDSPGTETAGFRVVALNYYLGPANRRDVYVLNAPPIGPAAAALRRAHHLCVIGDGLSPDTNRLLEGVAIDHIELFAYLGTVGTATRPPPVAFTGTMPAAR